MMDPIEPISSRLPAAARASGAPIERLERITRERDRPEHERERSAPRRRPPARPRPGADDDPDAPRHIDVRA